MRASHIALLSLVALASSSLGCGSVEVPRICFAEQSDVPGVPVGGSVETPAIPFAVDLGTQIPLLRTNTSDADVRIVEVTITPVAGSPDLSGIQTARVQVQPAAGAAQDVASYQRNPAAPAPTAIVLEGDTVNLAPYLVDGRANLAFTLSGQPPPTQWRANVETCMRGETTVSP